MRGSTSKLIRREAKRKAVEWYRGLLSQEENEKATDEELLEYVVKSGYVTVDGQVTVSENTLRKFTLKEKQNHGSESTITEEH